MKFIVFSLLSLSSIVAFAGSHITATQCAIAEAETKSEILRLQKNIPQKY